jgi:anaerobic ribonucleoside-triphosphate reductase activating protein
VFRPHLLLVAEVACEPNEPGTQARIARGQSVRAGDARGRNVLPFNAAANSVYAGWTSSSGGIWGRIVVPQHKRAHTDIGAAVVNVAATCVGTRALGPNLRSVIWVQGCPFRCASCIAPDWIPHRPARLISPGELAADLLADPRITGLTLSGGEPMAQASALARTVRLAKVIRDITVICFTGYRLAELRRSPQPAGASELLAEVDVLIDGRYVARLDDGRGLRGSTNQRIHYLTDRLRGYEFGSGVRTAELRFRDDDVYVVGVPPPKLLPALDAIAGSAAPGLGLRLASAEPSPDNRSN